MPTTLTTPTTSTTDIDPATGLPKIKPVVTPTLPQQDPNKQNSTVKLSDAAMSGAAAPAPAPGSGGGRGRGRGGRGRGRRPSDDGS